jgi:hypothetical protein
MRNFSSPNLPYLPLTWLRHLSVVVRQRFLTSFVIQVQPFFSRVKYHIHLSSDDLVFIPNYVLYYICSLCNYAVSDADYSPPPHSTTATGGPGLPYHRGFTNTLRNTTLGRTLLDE